MWRAHDTRRTDHAPVPRRQTERRGNLPYGCSVQSGGDWGARINTRADGRNDGNYISVTSPFVPDPNKMIAMANARQSSQYSSSARPDVSFAADKCLTDSGTRESMCVTNKEMHPWWQATAAEDGALYDITSVIVRNRADCIGTSRVLAPFPLSPIVDSQGSPDARFASLTKGATSERVLARTGRPLLKNYREHRGRARAQVGDPSRQTRPCSPRTRS